MNDKEFYKKLFDGLTVSDILIDNDHYELIFTYRYEILGKNDKGMPRKGGPRRAAPPKIDYPKYVIYLAAKLAVVEKKTLGLEDYMREFKREIVHELVERVLNYGSMVDWDFAKVSKFVSECYLYETDEEAYEARKEAYRRRKRMIARRLQDKKNSSFAGRYKALDGKCPECDLNVDKNRFMWVMEDDKMICKRCWRLRSDIAPVLEGLLESCVLLERNTEFYLECFTCGVPKKSEFYMLGRAKNARYVCKGCFELIRARVMKFSGESFKSLEFKKLAGILKKVK